MEVHLDRTLVDRRIFPSINVAKSGTRKEELLYHPDEYTKVSVLRRALTEVPAVEAMELLLSKMRKTPNNIAFLMALDQEEFESLDFRPKLSEIKQGMTLNRIIMGVIGFSVFIWPLVPMPHRSRYTLFPQNQLPRKAGLPTPFGPEKARFSISEGLIGSANVSMTVLRATVAGCCNVNRWRGQLGLEPVEEKDEGHVETG